MNQLSTSFNSNQQKHSHNTISKHIRSYQLLCLFVFLLIGSVQTINAQAATEHWLPPLTSMKSSVLNQRLQQVSLHISNPNTTAATVHVLRGTSGTPITGSPFTINAGESLIINSVDLGGGTTNNYLVVDRSNSTIQTDKSIKVEADLPVSVSYRGVSGDTLAQTGHIVSKGPKALGTTFRAGVIPDQQTVAWGGPNS